MKSGSTICFHYCLLFLYLTVGGASAKGDVIYNYSGNPFSDYSGAPANSAFITASLTFVSPLGPDLQYADGSSDVTKFVTSWTISDQNTTISNVPSSLYAEFETNDSAQIIGWNVSADSWLNCATDIRLFTGMGTNCCISDAAVYPDGTAFNLFQPGGWSSQQAEIPEPSEFWPLGLAFTCAAVSRKRSSAATNKFLRSKDRRRKTAQAIDTTA